MDRRAGGEPTAAPLPPTAAGRADPVAVVAIERAGDVSAAIEKAAAREGGKLANGSPALRTRSMRPSPTRLLLLGMMAVRVAAQGQSIPWSLVPTVGSARTTLDAPPAGCTCVTSDRCVLPGAVRARASGSGELRDSRLPRTRRPPRAPARSPCTTFRCSCVCNLVAGACDSNCCCDSEVREPHSALPAPATAALAPPLARRVVQCAAEDVARFRALGTCLPEGPVNVSLRTCIDTASDRSLAVINPSGRYVASVR